MSRTEKLVAQLLVIVVALIPFWLFLAMRSLLDPEGFWQNLVMLGVGFYILGSIQLILLILGGMFSYTIWTDN